ncbi:hypothetical protein M885DRAFT_511430 [Pelagophyceae sp. CCMP2097]|nr:hypothetical protein M885DRAFT_511430 [Pelagophyceae sp. CCMP2097]
MDLNQLTFGYSSSAAAHHRGEFDSEGNVQSLDFNASEYSYGDKSYGDTKSYNDVASVAGSETDDARGPFFNQAQPPAFGAAAFAAAAFGDADDDRATGNKSPAGFSNGSGVWGGGGQLGAGGIGVGGGLGVGGVSVNGYSAQPHKLTAHPPYAGGKHLHHGHASFPNHAFPNHAFGATANGGVLGGLRSNGGSAANLGTLGTQPVLKPHSNAPSKTVVAVEAATRALHAAVEVARDDAARECRDAIDFSQREISNVTQRITQANETARRWQVDATKWAARCRDAEARGAALEEELKAVAFVSKSHEAHASEVALMLNAERVQRHGAAKHADVEAALQAVDAAAMDTPEMEALLRLLSRTAQKLAREISARKAAAADGTTDASA